MILAKAYYITAVVILFITFILPISSSSNNTQTLLVIYGQYRSFDLTCPSIVENIVKHYYPHVHIILTLDEVQGFVIPQVGGVCLQPYINNLTIIDGKVDLKGACPQSIEFVLVKRAFDYIFEHRLSYHYAIKLRFDNVIKSPILPLPYIFHPQLNVTGKHLSRALRRPGGVGHHPTQSSSPFVIFQDLLSQQYLQRNQKLPSFAQRAYDWIITSGNPVFIHSNVFDVDLMSHHTFIPHRQWNRQLREYVLNHTSIISSMAESVSLVKKTMQKFRPVYLIGSTWIQFGFFNILKKSTYEVLNQFGKISPADFGIENVHWYIKNATEAIPRYVNVTESVLRLTYKKNNWQLIDLINQRDYDISFNDSDLRSFDEAMHDPKLHYWLVRTCQRNPQLGGCQVNKLTRIQPGGS